MKTITINKKGLFDYEVLEKINAGIVLKGWEVKSVKTGHVNLNGAFIKDKNAEIYLFGATIPSYKYGFAEPKEAENRERKLLLRQREIKNILSKIKEGGITAIPLEIYLTDSGLIKLTLAIAKGKKKFDKRAKLKEKDLKRNIDRERRKFNF